MVNHRSIRFRLTLWYAAILFVALGVFSVLLWLSLRQRLISEVDRELEARAQRFEQYFLAESTGSPKESVKDELEEFCQALPAGSIVLLQGQSGFLFRYPPLLTSTAVESRTFRHIFEFRGEQFVIEMSTSISDLAHTLELLRFLFLSLTPAVIAVACIGGAWLSARALRPVENMTRAAHTISIENLSERLPAPGTGDELARLTGVLNSMLERIESAVKTLSQFAADASHELRTPLAVVRTTAELALRRDRTPESYRESLRGVATEAERMTRLIEELLILARTNTTAVEMPSVPLNAVTLLQEICAEIQPLADARAIRLDCRFQDPGRVIVGNPAALHRLFLALLDNAVKFSNDSGVVTLSAQAAADGFAISIEDSGCGIGEADLPHIFERFYRAESARTDVGYGLGLSLADLIARAHGARIEVDSKPGRGSRFTVIFPADKLRPNLLDAQGKPAGSLADT